MSNVADVVSENDVVVENKTTYASNAPDKADLDEYRIVWSTKGVPSAVPADQSPLSTLEVVKKSKSRAKKAVAKVDGVVVEVANVIAEEGPLALTEKKKTKTKAAKGSAKTPKFVPEWMEIREAIRSGRKLKEIAAQYNVRYYDVYRVKVHGMDL